MHFMSVESFKEIKNMKTGKICSVIFLFCTSTAFGKVFEDAYFKPFSRHRNGKCDINISDTSFKINSTMCEFLQIFVAHNKHLYLDTNYGIGLLPPQYKTEVKPRQYTLISYFDNIIMTMPDDNCYASVINNKGLLFIKSELMCLIIQKLLISNKKEYMTIQISPATIAYADTVLEIRSYGMDSSKEISVYDFNLQSDTYVSIADIKFFGTNSNMKSFIVMNDTFHPFINDLVLYIKNPDMFLRSVDYYLNKIAVSVTIKRNLDHTYDVIKMVSLNDVIRDERCNNVKRSKRNPEDNTMDINNLMNLYLYSLNTKSVIRFSTVDNPVNQIIYILVPMVDGTVTHLPLFMSSKIYPNRRVRQSTGWSSPVQRNIQNMGFRAHDERGRILSQSLGGGQEILNVVPMVNSINQHMGEQRLIWRSNEKIMEDFLASGFGHVDYFVFIQYENLTLSNNPLYLFSPHELRPTHFTQSFTLFFKNGSYTEYGPMISINNSTFECPEDYFSFD